jgi:transcriptional regulator with XRE-family HTH domain
MEIPRQGHPGLGRAPDHRPGGQASVSGETFAAMLRRHRIEAGLSQNQLARLAKIDPAYVNRMERALANYTTVPSRRVVLGLADALEMGPGPTDRFLFAAGLAPETDWQSRAIAAETIVAMVRDAVRPIDDQAEQEEPTPIPARLMSGIQVRRL